jgi:hypothetical protein
LALRKHDQRQERRHGDGQTNLAILLHADLLWVSREVFKTFQHTYELLQKPLSDRGTLAGLT